MNWFQLIAALLPIAEEITKAIADAQALGKAPADIHASIVEHAAGTPAKIREI
jgi:hypothetical protein